MAVRILGIATHARSITKIPARFVRQSSRNKMKNTESFFEGKRIQKKNKAIFYGLLAMIVVLAIGIALK